MMTLIEKSTQLISTEQSLVMAEVESIQHMPQLTLSKWFASNNEQECLAPQPEVAQSAFQIHDPPPQRPHPAQSSLYSLQKSCLITDQPLQYTVNGSSAQYSYQQCTNYSQSSSGGLRASVLLPQIKAVSVSTADSSIVPDNVVAAPDAKYSFKDYGKKLERCKTLLSSRHQKEKFLSVTPFSPAQQPVPTTASEVTPINEIIKKRKSSSNDSSVSSGGSCTTSASKENSLSDDIHAALALDNFKKGRVSSSSDCHDGLIRFGDDPNEVKERMRRAVAVTAVLSLNCAGSYYDGSFQEAISQPKNSSANSLTSLQELSSKEEDISGSVNICQPSRSRFSELPTAGQLNRGDAAKKAEGETSPVGSRSAVVGKTESSNAHASAVVKMEGGLANDGSSASSRKCHAQGCLKCAQGATKFCISHGGGKRCTYPNCDRGARDKFFCAAHGGGKRCSIFGCDKSAVSSLCILHCEHYWI